jgi:hypothetical protein
VFAEDKNMNPKNESIEHDFSLELKSSRNLSRLSTSNEPSQGVLIEGTLGKHVRAAFLESTILQVEGETGVLRLSIRKDEISDQKEGAKEASEEA